MSDGRLLELTPQEIKSGITPAATAFMGQAEEYTAITPGIRELVDEGRHKALYVPAVKFIISATLDMLSQPSVEERAPTEVAARSMVASHFARYVVDVGLRSGMFAAFYLQNADLKGASVLEDRFHLLSDPNRSEYLMGLGSAPFFDTSIASGGAFKFLQEQGMTDDHAQVIARSSGLLVVSGVNKDNADAAFDHLGTPYALADRFRFAPDTEEDEVAFVEETIAFLRSLHVEGGGCPSGKVELSKIPDLTLLEDYWAKIVNYMVPPNATAELPQD